MAITFQMPQTNRSKININQNWKFNRADITNAQSPSYNDATWSTVHLPHNFQNVSIDGGAYYRGIGWYRKHFSLDASSSAKRITLYFEGAMTVSEVWINGTKLATHYGGFTPFTYDITQYCTFGTIENVLAVRLNNEYQKLVPPEKPDSSGVDFEMYGGIYRDVWIISSNKLYVPEPVHDWSNKWANQGGHFINFTNVSTSAATGVIRTWVKNTTGDSVTCRVVTSITNANEEVVQTATSLAQTIPSNMVVRFAQNLPINSPSLWFPWAPYLYTVYTVIYNGETAVDYYKTRVGIRKLEFTKTTGAFCNGTHFKILGLNRHQTWPFVGHAVPNNQQRRDAEMLKAAGCNFIRCSHYLQDDAFMDACDSLGLFVWTETPGWHCCNSNGLPSKDSTWRAREIDEVRFMVRTARNHPSIAVWGPAINEAVSDPTIENPMNNACHEEDSTRVTSAARAGWQHPKGAGANIYDVYGDNQFTPGSIPTSNPDLNCLGYINTEHTGHTYPASRRDSTEGTLQYHAWLHGLMAAEARTRGDWVIGGMGWCMYDYYTGLSIRDHGVMDLMHIPKFAYYFYKSQSAADNYVGTIHPMVKITNYYTATSSVNRDVYHNCDSVRLYKNGIVVATQGPGTEMDVPHSPSTFRNVPYVAGMLTVEGFLGGKIVARDTARTPGAPAAIKLVADPPVLEGNGSDFSRIEAWIIDANGTVVPYSNNKVTFTVTGVGTQVGDNPIAAQSGACITLAKAGLTSGSIRITASATNLTGGSVDVTVSPSTAVFGNFSSVIPVHAEQGFSHTYTITGNRFFLPNNLIGKPVKVSIYDVSGRLLFQTIQKKCLVDFSKFTHGMNGIRIIHVKQLL